MQAIIQILHINIWTSVQYSTLGHAKVTAVEPITSSHVMTDERWSLPFGRVTDSQTVDSTLLYSNLRESPSKGQVYSSDDWWAHLYGTVDPGAKAACWQYSSE